MNKINDFLSLTTTKSNTEWILKSIIKNPCVIIVFRDKTLSDAAKYKFLEMTNGINRFSSDEFPKFISLEEDFIDMCRPVIFDNSCFF